MLMYLKNPANYNVQKDNYLMEDAPRNGFMTPDMAVYQTVKDILAKHTGTPNLSLPKESKDIGAYFVEFIQTDESDFKWEKNTLKWGNDTFVEIEGETGYY